VTLWDPDTTQYSNYYRLEVIADGRAIVLFCDRAQWTSFAEACLPVTASAPTDPPKRRGRRPKARNEPPPTLVHGDNISNPEGA